MFLGLPDPDPSLNVQKSDKKLEFIVYTVMGLLYDFLSSKNDVNVPSKRISIKLREKIYCFWRLEGH